jgi:hypothetical protein
MEEDAEDGCGRIVPSSLIFAESDRFGQAPFVLRNVWIYFISPKGGV